MSRMKAWKVMNSPSRSGGDRQLDRELAAVLAQAASTSSRRLSSVASPVRTKRSSPRCVRLAQGGRDDQLGEQLSQRLVPRPAEHLGARVGFQKVTRPVASMPITASSAPSSTARMCAAVSRRRSRRRPR